MDGLKDCPTCNTAKDVGAFNRNRSRPDGLHGECRPCQLDRKREWRQRNREHVRAYERKRWREQICG